jgi:hypothetical protein
VFLEVAESGMSAEDVGRRFHERAAALNMGLA